MTSPHVLIVGGGVQGMMLSYDLAAAGCKVSLVEAATSLGGLAGSTTLEELDDLQVDRFYHCILSSDARLQALLQELNLQDQLRFTTTGMAFHGGPKHGLQSMSSPLEFLRFPLISFPSRIRLALSLLYSAFVVRDGERLESISVEPWLRQLCGDENFDVLWGPLLQSKFDDGFEDLPANYMWARLRRMLSTRDKSTGTEQMGHLIGGYQTLVDTLQAKMLNMGVEIMLETRVVSLQRNEQGAITGAHVTQNDKTQVLHADCTILTVGNALIKDWIGDKLPERTRRPLDSISYLAIACPLLVLDRSLSEFYTINLVDRSLQMTGVIETTRIIDPALLGGRHLVYLPYYCRQNNEIMTWDDDKIMALALKELAQVIPNFDPSWILARRVFRARATEPIHPVTVKRELVPYKSGLQGLYITNSSQVHPDLVNCEAMTANVMRALSVMYRDYPSLRSGATCLSR